MIVGGCVRLFTSAIRQKNIHCKIVFVTIRTPNREKTAAAGKKVVRSQIKIKAASESLSVSHHFSLEGKGKERVGSENRLVLLINE